MKDQTNVIQFPKPSPSPKPAGLPKTAAMAKASPPKKVLNASLATTVCSLFAIALAAGAANTSLFTSNEGRADIPSESRIPASVDPATAEVRDATWEKSIADALASAEVRDVASIAVGHDASLDESLRFGVLERKYTILRDLKRNEVESIILQGSVSEPAILSNRAEFLGKYGRWMSDKYSSSELASSESSKDHKKVESFKVYDSKHQAYAVARFELDNFQRLLAFHFEPL